MANAGRTLVLVLILAGVVAYAYLRNDPLPDCADAALTQTVVNGMKNRTKEIFGRELASQVGMSLVNIRQRSADSRAGTVICAADLTIKLADVSQNRPITYTVSRTSKRGEYYVESKGE